MELNKRKVTFDLDGTLLVYGTHELRPGAEELLTNLEKSRRKLVLWSTAGVEWIIDALEANTGLEDHFWEMYCQAWPTDRSIFKKLRDHPRFDLAVDLWERSKFP